MKFDYLGGQGPSQNFTHQHDHIPSMYFTLGFKPFSLTIRRTLQTAYLLVMTLRPGTCFLKVPKLFGPIPGATTAFMSSQRRGSKPSNFAILSVFLVLKTCKKITFSKQADCSLTASFSGPKSSRHFRETGPWGPFLEIPENVSGPKCHS